MAESIYESCPGSNEDRRKQKDPHLHLKRNYALFRMAGAAFGIREATNADLYPVYIRAEAWDLLKQLSHLEDKMRKIGKGEDHFQGWPE